MAPTDDADAPDSRRFREIHAQYEALLAHPNAHRLDYQWIEGYEARRRLMQHLPVAAGGEDSEEPPPQPSEV